MDKTLASINVADPSTAADEEIEVAGVTSAATEQAERKEKKSKKSKKAEKSEDVEIVIPGVQPMDMHMYVIDMWIPDGAAGMHTQKRGQTWCVSCRLHVQRAVCMC